MFRTYDDWKSDNSAYEASMEGPPCGHGNDPATCLECDIPMGAWPDPSLGDESPRGASRSPSSGETPLGPQPLPSVFDIDAEDCASTLTGDARDPLAWPRCTQHGQPLWHCQRCEDDLEALIVAGELVKLERVRDRGEG